MMTVDELRELAERIVNRDLVHLNCVVTVEPVDDALEVQVKPRRFAYEGVVFVGPDKPDEHVRLEIAALRDVMIEHIFGDAFHERAAE